jgi:hypothetical protein
MKKHTGRIRKALAFTLLGLLLLCLGSAGFFFLSNRSLPTHSQVVDRLSVLEKARLAEAIHLRQTLGEETWPGWSRAEIPIIVYNEEYAFLTGYPDPPDGWVKMPQGERRGRPWDAVRGDMFEGQVYYRQRLSDPQKTPENFTVVVGERWAATLQTREYSEVAFYAGFLEELPPFLVKVFPYRLAWSFLLGETETHIGALEHEAFHAYQGSLAAGQLAEAEGALKVEDRYPFEDPALDEAWKAEMKVLLQAAQASSANEAQQYARQFLTLRTARRASLGLAPNLIELERQREWLEGLAKYAELSLVRVAGSTAGYQPQPGLVADPDFHAYRDRKRFWSQQLKEAGNTSGRSGETRFYYSGNVLAVVLDRLAPGWKERALPGGMSLEDLLQEAVHE